MNPFTRLPIRLTIPLLLLLLALLVEGYTVNQSRARADAEEEERARVLLVQDMTQLQDTIADRLRKGDWEGVQSAMAVRGANANTAIEVLADDAGNVVASTRRALIGSSIGRALPEVETGLLKEVATTLNGRVLLSEDRQSISACYPVILGARAGEIRPYRVGILYQRHDLALAKATRRQALERQALVSAGFFAGGLLLLGLFLHLILTSRVGRLVSAAQQLATGDLTVRVGLEGKDELAQIGRSFDRMAGELAAGGQALQRLNRELRAIGRCDQILVRAEDEQTLLDDICRVVCEETKYPLVWVGIAENDDARTIRPAAWAGAEGAAYVAGARLSWADDTERGRGPAGKVIRTGEVIISQNLATDPHMAPWREDALRRGYRSGIALPLQQGGVKPFGALFIYAAEVDAFPPDEVRLLGELARDLAFGIQVIRTRIERKRAEDQVLALNRELEGRVRERTAQLEAANKELEEFSYSMSHDLRAPLRAIDGFTHLLEKHSGSLDGEGQRLLGVVSASAVRMGRLVDELLEFLQIGRRKISFEPVDTVQVVREVFAELEASVPGRTLRLELKAPPPLWGDRAMIRQLLTNLLSNAVKFTRPRSPAVIEVGGCCEGGETRCYVKDNGVGFDMRYVHKLFKVFERVHPVGQFEGSGTGLAVVRRIVGRHAGRVWAEGEPEAGATIHFALPAQDEDGGERR